MFLRGIRGAITVAHNTSEAILAQSKILLESIMAENNLSEDAIASIFFSVTPDLDAEFPAKSARDLGMTMVPMLCMNEIPVPGSLAMCIRILLHVNTEKSASDMVHVYLGDAVQLRPDRAGD